MTIAALLFLAALGLFGYQCVSWLREGAWTPYPVSWLWLQLDPKLPHAQWKGVDQIVQWLLDLPLSFSLIVLALACMWIADKIEQVEEARARERVRQKLGHN